jgi:hypothetical protein
MDLRDAIERIALYGQISELAHAHDVSPAEVEGVVTRRHVIIPAAPESA